jgi:hypothetical protein
MRVHHDGIVGGTVGAVGLRRCGEIWEIRIRRAREHVPACKSLRCRCFGWNHT